MSTRFSLKLFLYVLADEFGSSRSCVSLAERQILAWISSWWQKARKNIRKILMMLSNVNIPVSHSLSCDITLLLLCTVCRVKWESVSGLTWQCCCLARGFITFFMLLRVHDRARGSREHFRCDFQIFADFLSSPLQLAFFCFQASSTQYHNNHSSSWFVSLRPSLTLCVILLLVLYANGIFVRDFHVSRDPTMTTRNEEHSFYSLKAKTAAAVCALCVPNSRLILCCREVSQVFRRQIFQKAKLSSTVQKTNIFFPILLASASFSLSFEKFPEL